MEEGSENILRLDDFVMVRGGGGGGAVGEKSFVINSHCRGLLLDVKLWGCRGSNSTVPP